MLIENLENLLLDITEKNMIPAVSIAVGKKDSIIYSNCFGKNPETGKYIDDTSRFDVASLTKIFSGICFMKLAEQDLIHIDDKVCEYFPQLDVIKPIEKDGRVIGQCDCSQITWKHVLTHTSGMGWTRPKTRPSLPHLDQGLDDIFSLPMKYQTGQHVIYTDIPVVLMGKAMEMCSHTSLDQLVDTIVCQPLNLKNTGYLINNSTDNINRIVPTEFDDIYRRKRIWGCVHDENAYLMNGVSAHAGIFSTAQDLCVLGMAYNRCLYHDGLLKRNTVYNMIHEHVSEDGDRRGLMWQLSGNSETSYTKYLSNRSYGHSGFTGCFMWIDPVSDTVIVFLSNDVYNGRENRQLTQYRGRIMQYITSN